MQLSHLILSLLLLVLRAQAIIEIKETHQVGKNITVIILGVAIIFLFSFTGTVLPIVLKKKKYLKIDTVSFGSLKIFGVGIIVGVAFIHMLIPGDQLLTSSIAPYFFREKHPHFCGALVIIGVTCAHLIQVLTSHIIQTRNTKKKASKNESGDLEQGTRIPSALDITENKSRTIPANEMIFLEVREFDDEVDKREKQFVFYLVELSVAIHSILIGFAFGLTSVDRIIPFTFALLFHQFFEGMAISTIFLEAKFTRIKPYLVMIGIFTLTLPIGAFVGIIIRESLNDDDPLAVAFQGCIVSIASGILIYDSLASILAHHTNSKIWNTMSIGKKAVQMFCFYLGLFVISIINSFI